MRLQKESDDKRENERKKKSENQREVEKNKREKEKKSSIIEGNLRVIRRENKRNFMQGQVR